MRHIFGFLQLLASRVELCFPRTPIYAEKLAFWFTELEVRGSPNFFYVGVYGVYRMQKPKL